MNETFYVLYRVEGKWEVADNRTWAVNPINVQGAQELVNRMGIPHHADRVVCLPVEGAIHFSRDMAWIQVQP